MNAQIASLMLLACLASPVLSSSDGFLAPHKPKKLIVDALFIQDLMTSTFGTDHGVDEAYISALKAKVKPVFTALPKIEGKPNSIEIGFMKYAVQRYFSRYHGWIVKGFEPFGKARRMHGRDAHIGRTPAHSAPEMVDEMLQVVASSGSADIMDVVMLVAVYEQYVCHGVTEGVDVSFRLNNHSTALPISRPAFDKVMSSYFVIKHLQGTTTSAQEHFEQKGNVRVWFPSWNGTWDFVEGIANNYAYEHNSSRNPFVPETWAFQDVNNVAQTVNQQFAMYSNIECHTMKSKLSALDPKKTGRVPLADFYKSSQNGTWEFAESSTYLATVGALDYSSEVARVIIPNYILGMNNCLGSDLSYSVCCASECDGIYEHLEKKLAKPFASAAEILHAIEGGIAYSPSFSASVPLGARNASVHLRDALDKMAMLHHNLIPLHGRLIAQWLHYAFPHECPYPHTQETLQSSFPADAKNLFEPILTKNEMLEYIAVWGNVEASNESSLGMWTMQEELLGDTFEPELVGGSDKKPKKQKNWLHSCMSIAMIATAGPFIVKELFKMLRFGSGKDRSGSKGADNTKKQKQTV